MSNMIVRIMYYCKLMKSYIEVKSWNGISADMDRLLDVDWLVDIDLRNAKKAKVLVERTREEPFDAP